MSDEAKEIMLEVAQTAEYLKGNTDPEITAALEQSGVLMRVGRSKWKRKLSPKGIKAALNISIATQEE